MPLTVIHASRIANTESFTFGNVTANIVTSTGASITGNVTFTGSSNGITFADGSKQTTSFAAASNYANAAFIQANSAYAAANSGGAGTDTYARDTANSAFTAANSAGSYANSGFTAANSAGSYANSAFTKANNALANTNGAIFGGDLNVTGKFSVVYSSGDEGGEIFLAQAQTNTTLNGGITVDSYQNKIRFFEQGGSARGAYIDLTQCVGGAGTNILNPGATPDSTAREWANSAGSYANSAFIKANAAFNQANTGGGGTASTNKGLTTILGMVFGG